MFFIAAPFGNYINFRQQFLNKKIISVSGTWTLNPRPGRFMQVVKTLRHTKRGWVNKLGLRNKGIDFALKQKHDILSISAIDYEDWRDLHKKIPKDIDVEVNLGCPNVQLNIWPGFANFTRDRRKWSIAKISPVLKETWIDFIVEAGFRQIHASNTIPTDRGGLSGKEIIPHTIRLLKYIKKNYPEVEVIAGGGITSKEDVERYRDYGADHFSLGTVCFTPWKIKKIIS